MKALSLTQPWATLLTLGEKKIETRSWSTRFRGVFAIHASKGFPRWARDMMHEDPNFVEVLSQYGYMSSSTLPTGAIIGTANLTDCLPTSHVQRPDPAMKEYHFGDYSPNRYMFFTENAQLFAEPIPCAGKLGFWDVPTELLSESQGI